MFFQRLGTGFPYFLCKEVNVALPQSHRGAEGPWATSPSSLLGTLPRSSTNQPWAASAASSEIPRSLDCWPSCFVLCLALILSRVPFPLLPLVSARRPLALASPSSTPMGEKLLPQAPTLPHISLILPHLEREAGERVLVRECVPSILGQASACLCVYFPCLTVNTLKGRAHPYLAHPFNPSA